MTSEEIEKQHLDAFGPALGPLYHALHNDVVWLHVKWGQFMKLYGTSQKRIDPLNEAAGFFFRIVEDALFEEVILRIVRLVVSPQQKQGNYKNLILSLLKGNIKDRTVASEVKKLLKAATKKGL